MSKEIGRRSFLTHSAVAVGGVALASTVVDGLISDVASAATVGVNTGTPKKGGTLTVAVGSDAPNYHTFNGQQGAWDSAGFTVGNALYDPLFVTKKDGSGVLPFLALSATPNSTYTVWTVALRQGISFYDPAGKNSTAFNADVVIANLQAAQADTTVGLAIQPILKNVTKVDAYTVNFNLKIPFCTFDTNLAEQQIAYMAHPAVLGSTTVNPYTGYPIGTGPFYVTNWQLNVGSNFKKNPNYWRTDAKARQLPYLDALNFKVIVDPTARNQALQSGSVDMIWQNDNPSVAALAKMKGINSRNDLGDPRDPNVNHLLMNNSGTLNQYFLWAGAFAASIGVPGVATYLAKGQAAPTQVQLADYAGTTGAVDPSSLTWNTKLKPVLNDPSIRKAVAQAVNRATYFKVIDGGVGAAADGPFKKTSPFYTNPNFPAYDPTAAKALVDAYKSKNNVSTVGFVMDIASGSATAQKQFAFFQQALSAVGITVTPRPLVTSTIIQNAIYGQFDCSIYNQWGGTNPGLNYVWWNSTPATALGFTALPAGVNIHGAVNFAHQEDSGIETAMLTALSSQANSTAYKTAWQSVMTQFAQDVTYIPLDVVVTAWAARTNVQNWAYATAGDGRTQTLQFRGGATRFEYIWKS